MRNINLNQNKVVILDNDDFERLRHFHWCYKGERNGAPGYAIRHVKVGTKVTTVYMQRDIMNPPPGYEVIFKNFNRLDCQKENLAIVTKDQARRHRRVRPGVKGAPESVERQPEPEFDDRVLDSAFGGGPFSDSVDAALAGIGDRVRELVTEQRGRQATRRPRTVPFTGPDGEGEGEATVETTEDGHRFFVEISVDRAFDTPSVVSGEGASPEEAIANAQAEFAERGFGNINFSWPGDEG